MIFCLKGTSEKCFSFIAKVNATLNFPGALEGHSGTQVLTGHLRTCSLGGNSKGTQELGHLRHLRYLSNQGSWALRYLQHSGTWKIRTLKQLGTRGTLFSRLIKSFLLPYPTNQEQDLKRKRSLKGNYLVKLSTQQSLSSAIQRKQCQFTLTCNYISLSYIQFS